MKRCRISGGAAGFAQLLSQLQHLQQLTHLVLNSVYAGEYLYEGGTPPAAAFAALTASSKLQFLAIGKCTLPVGVWQHVFPAGRCLPHLTSVDVWSVKEPAGEDAAAPEGSRLVSCCPGLACLALRFGQCTTELLAALSRLSGLHVLHVSLADESRQDATGCICQLTNLRELSLFTCSAGCKEGLLLRLTQLRQLTSLLYYMGDTMNERKFHIKVSPACHASGRSVRNGSYDLSFFDNTVLLE
jgi:hypothetical protein